MTTSIRNGFVLTLLAVTILMQGCQKTVSPDDAEIDTQSVEEEVKTVKGASQSLTDILATNAEPLVFDDSIIGIDANPSPAPEPVPTPVKPIEVTTDIVDSVIDIDPSITDITIPSVVQTPPTVISPSFRQPQNEEAVVIQTPQMEMEKSDASTIIIPPTILTNTPPQPIPVITKSKPPIPPQVPVMPQDTTVITAAPETVQTYTVIPVLVYPNCYIARYNHTKIVPFILVQPGMPFLQSPATQVEPQTESTYKYYAIPVNPIPSIPPIVSVPYMLPQQPSKPFPPRRIR
ncbi:MAG: hypothetical protein LBU65_02085 [Planctomycetaceae bacterium]|jgi:hypothetical protein|nr:hypothetical protein [Planctomycetaceae bacterium]